MLLEIKGKKALVTGASRGIGRCIAEVLFEEGCQMALNARNVDELNLTVSGMPGTVAIPGDVTQVEIAQNIITETVLALGRLDILICNTGGGESVPPGEETPDEWQRVFALNFWSATNIIEAARSALVESQGVIVCISSICGLEVVSGAPLTYSSAKAALNAYVRGIARPLGAQGVRINAVAPGNIFFEGSTWSRKLMENKSAVMSTINRDVALAKLGTPREVADLVAYLASPRSNFATGVIWPLDGGQTHS